MYISALVSQAIISLVAQIDKLDAVSLLFLSHSGSRRGSLWRALISIVAASHGWIEFVVTVGWYKWHH